MLFGERIMLPDEQRRADRPGLRRHGDRASIATTIEDLCHAGIVPVIPSMCITEDGQKLNVNADTAATAVAQALEAEKLVYPQRRQRRAPRQERPRLADPLAHGRRGPTS